MLFAAFAQYTSIACIVCIAQYCIIQYRKSMCFLGIRYQRWWRGDFFIRTALAETLTKLCLSKWDNLYYSDWFHQAALPRGRRGRIQDSPAGVRAGQAPAWRSHAVLAISSGRRYRSGAASGKKPEMFSRPEIKMNSSAEDWADFEVEWEQCKEEYTLAGSALIRQLYSSCSDKLKQSLSRSTGGRSSCTVT